MQAEPNPPTVEGTPVTFQVSVFAHPLRQQADLRALCEVGPTLAELGAGENVLAYVDGAPAAPSYCPSEGQHVLLRATLAGGDDGGKMALRLVATVALIYVAGAYGAQVGTQLGFTGAAAQSVGAGVLTLAGSLAINAVFPPPDPKLDLSDAFSLRPERSITGVRNQAVPFGPILRLYGKHRFYPSLASRYYTEQIGDDQYLFCLFSLGYGPLSIPGYDAATNTILSTFLTDNAKIGDTALSNFEIDPLNELRIHDGSTPATFSLFTRAVDEETLSLTFDVDAHAEVRTTQANARTASLDFYAPALARRGSDTGRPYGAIVGFKVEYRAVGAGAWTLLRGQNHGGIVQTSGSVDFDDHYPKAAAERFTGDVVGWYTPPGAPVDAFTLSGDDYKPFRGSLRWDFPAPGQYEIRVTRLSAYALVFDGFHIPYDVRQFVEPDDNLFSEFSWTKLRSFSSDGAVKAPAGQAFIEMRIKVTDQLSGVLDSFSVIAQSILNVWTGAAYVLQPTSNPAAIYRDILMGSANARPLSITRLDEAALKQWALDCASAGYEFNAPIDGRSTVFEMLKSVASSGRASFAMPNGKFSVIQDKPQSVAVQLFTPRNAWDFKGTRTYPKLPHALNVKFKNRDADWVQDQRVVYADGYSLDGSGGTTVATEFETLALFGETNSDMAWKRGRYHYASAKLQPESFSFTADVESIVCIRGDLVQLQHDAILVGLGSGRILSQSPASNPTSITLDEEFTVESGKTYSVRFRTDSGAQFLRAVTNAPGVYKTLTLASAANGAQIGDLISFGETGRETLPGIVKTIEPQDDLQARITCVPYNDAIYTADIGPIPDYDPFVTIPPGVPPAPAITNVLRGPAYALRGNDGTLTPRILVSYQFASSDISVAKVQAGIRRVGDLTYTTVFEQENNGLVAFIISDDTVDYELRIRGISAAGIPGIWAETTAPAEDVLTGDVTAIALQEQPDTPSVPNHDLSTVVCTVTPPVDVAYDYALIDYRRDDQVAWFELGPTDEHNQARVTLNRDGTTYVFRARAVSVGGHVDSGGPTASITLSTENGTIPGGDPDAGSTPDAALNVTGLRAHGQPAGNGNFTGRDALFDWNAVVPPAGQTLMDYRVRIKDSLTSNVVRVEYVVAPKYTYDYARNSADFLAAGYATAQRTFIVEVIARTVQGKKSATPAQITGTNAAPVLPGDFSFVAFYTSAECRFTKPTDTDYDHAEVYLSTVSGFTPALSNRVYSGPETQPIGIDGVLDSTTYYCKVILYDLFGAGPTSAQFSATTSMLPGHDTTPPTTPGTVTLTSSVEQAKLYVSASLKASWGASTDNSGQVYYEVEYWSSSDTTERTVARTPSTDFTIFPVKIGETYNVRVRARDYAPAANVSPYTATATLTVAGDTVPPANVSGATATGALDKVVLSWTNPTDADFIESEINRGTTSGFTPGAGTVIGKTRGTAFVDANVVNATAYFYKFRTVDVSGNFSGYSAAVGPATPFKIDSINITSYMVNAAIQGAQIAAAAVDATKFAAGIEPVSIVSALPSPTGYTGPKTVLLTTASPVPKLYRYDPSVPQWTVAVDGADIIANSITAGSISAGAIGATQLAADAVIAGKIAANAISVREIAIGDFTNQLANADFELGDRNWSKGVGWSIVSDPTNARSGSWVASRSGNATTTAMTAQTSTAGDGNIRCVEGDTFYARAYFKRSAAGNAGFIQLQFLDASFAGLQTINGNQVTGTSYAISEATGTAPAGTVYVRARPQANNTADTVYCDQCGLFRVSGSVLIKDGAITTPKLVANAVTANELAANSVIAGKVAANAIDANALQANSVVAGKIAANAVTATEINVSQLSAISADMGAINAGTMTGATVRTASTGDRVIMDSVNGLRGISHPTTSDIVVFQMKLDGTGFIGAAPGVIQWSDTGTLIAGTLTGTGTIQGPLFKTTGTWSVEAGAQSLALDGDAAATYVLVYRNGTSSKFRMRDNGDMRLGGNLEIDTGGDLFSGKTSAVDTAHAGFWLGNNAGTPTFYIGSASDAEYFKWDGGLSIKTKNDIVLSGDRGDGTTAVLLDISVNTIGSDTFVLSIGDQTTLDRNGLYVKVGAVGYGIRSECTGGGGRGLFGIANGTSGRGVEGQGVNGGVFTATNPAVNGGANIRLDSTGITGKPTWSSNITSGSMVNQSGDMYWSVSSTGGSAAWRKVPILASKAAGGWAEMGDGTLIQWSSGSFAGGTTIAFPTAFPNTCRAVVVTPKSGGTYEVGADTFTASNFVLRNNIGAAAAMNWIAVGD